MGLRYMAMHDMSDAAWTVAYVRRGIALYISRPQL